MQDETNYPWVSKLITHFIKINKLLLFCLAIILVVAGSFSIILGELFLNTGNSHNSHFFQLMCDVLLIAAAIHLSIALCFRDLKELKDELIAAILMAAFSITLVMLHKGIEIFLDDNHTHYSRNDIVLLGFTMGGGLFMVMTIYLMIMKKEK